MNTNMYVYVCSIPGAMRFESSLMIIESTTQDSFAYNFYLFFE